MTPESFFLRGWRRAFQACELSDYSRVFGRLVDAYKRYFAALDVDREART